MPHNSADTTQLPILVYHRVAPVDEMNPSLWHLSPDLFEQQLLYLKNKGFYSVTLEQWQQAVTNRQALPGKAILITFDDGYYDFYTYAFPLLKKYGFSAMVFLIADFVGFYQPSYHLLGWQEIEELQQEGIEFGSHSLTHPRLTQLSESDARHELERSRVILSNKLQVPITAFAYPYNDSNSMIRKLTAEYGYSFGLSIAGRRSSWQDCWFDMPRIEIHNTDNLRQFIIKLYATLALN